MYSQNLVSWSEGDEKGGESKLVQPLWKTFGYYAVMLKTRKISPRNSTPKYVSYSMCLETATGMLAETQFLLQKHGNNPNTDRKLLSVPSYRKWNRHIVEQSDNGILYSNENGEDPAVPITVDEAHNTLSKRAICRTHTDDSIHIKFWTCNIK